MTIDPRRAWLIDNFLLLPLVGLFAFVFGGWIFIFDRDPPRAIFNFTITPQKVRPGELIVTSFDVVPLRSGRWNVETKHELIDSVDYIYMLDSRSIEYDPATSNTTMARPRQIPLIVPPGKMRYRISGCYSMRGLSLTSLWPICAQWEATFEVVH